MTNISNATTANGKYIINQKPLKPFVKWVGGKSQLLYKLEKLLPNDGNITYKKYCEPMVGGGALLFDVLNKYDFEEFYISDTNCELINAYNVIKNDVNTLIERLN